MLVGPESDGYVMECGKGDPNDKQLCLLGHDT